MTSKERVLSTLNFTNTQDRVPRQLWSLPWANEHCSEMMEQLARDFEWDFDGPDTVLKEPPTTKGDAYTVGEYVDEWGCVFTNIHRGVIGEVKKPIVEDEEWNDVEKVHIPEELLTFDIDQVNRSCERKQDKFLFASCCPRPFEQLEFIRGTANFYMDLMDPSPKMLEFMKRMHDFYSRLMEKWAKTDVDALNMMDDWGSQKDLLIDLGLDAVNSQLFCMGLENLEQFRGKITFWGEIDRQHLLPEGTPADIDRAVEAVYKTLWKDGGCIAQCEFGPGAKPENVYQVFKAWENIRNR